MALENPITSDDLTIDFASLLKLSVSDRVQAAALDKNFAQALMASLTPIQMAKAFPDYYRRELPDISNFILANRYLDAGGQFDQKGGGDYRSDRDLYHGESAVPANQRPGYAPEPTLEDMKAKLLEKGIDIDKTYEAIGDQGILEGDERIKYLQGMSDGELEKSGLQRVQTEDGKTIIKKMVAESATLSDEEVIKRASGKVAPGTGKLEGKLKRQKQVYDAFVSAGFSDNQAKALTAEVGRENDFSDRFIFGKHVDANNSEVNLGFFSWQGSRGKNLYNRMKENGLVDDNGNIIQSQESLNEMARFTKDEMQNISDYGRTKTQFLDNPNISQQEAAEVLGNNYIRWDMAGKKIDPGPHITKRNEYYNQIGEINKEFPGLVPENATPDQIKEARDKLIIEEKSKEADALTRILYNRSSPTSSKILGVTSTKTAADLIGGTQEITATQVGDTSTLEERSRGIPIEGIDTRLKVVGDAAIRAFEQQNPGYKIRVISGERPGATTQSGNLSKHALGHAIDYEIVGPDGRALPSLGDPTHPSGMGVGSSVGDYSPKYFQLMQMMEAARVNMSARDSSYADMGQISPGIFFKGGAWMDSMHASFGEGGALGDVYGGFKDPEQLIKEGTDPQIVEAVKRAIAAGAPVQGSDKSLNEADMQKYAEIMYETGVKPEEIANLKPKTSEQTISATDNSTSSSLSISNAVIQDTRDNLTAATPTVTPEQANPVETVSVTPVESVKVDSSMPGERVETASVTPVEPVGGPEEAKKFRTGGSPDVQDDENLSVIDEDGSLKWKMNSGEGIYIKPKDNEYADDKMNELSGRMDELDDRMGSPSPEQKQQKAAPEKANARPEKNWQQNASAVTYSIGSQGRAFKRTKFQNEGFHFNRSAPNSISS